MSAARLRAAPPDPLTRSLAGILLTTGHIAFAISFVMNLAGWGKQRSGGPTFFVEPAAPKAAEVSRG